MVNEGQDLANRPLESSAEGRLDSWKEIAAYLKCSERSVRRWEEEGLPVHRHPHKKKSGIYAYKAEIDAWWRSGHERLREIEESQGEAATGGARWWRHPWAIALTLLVVLAGIGWKLRPLRPGLRAVHIKSIAVLPLANLSGNSEQEYFADGMTDALITDLAQIGSLKVISRTSVMRYKRTEKPLPEIARELNVDGIVEGAVQRSGNRVHITAQLIHGPSDKHIWAHSYERDLGDMFALQQDVAEAIAREVGINLAPTPRRREAPHVAPAVYEAYLRGLYLLDASKTDAALAEFRKAVAADPAYAPAYTKIASAYFDRGFYSAMPPKEAFLSIKDAALRAIELDDGDAEAHAWLAIEKMHYDWDWPGAEREFKRSLQLNPSDPDVRHMYAHYLLTMGRWQDSMNNMEQAFENDPVGLDVAT